MSTSELSKVSEKERMDSVAFWRRHESALRENKLVSEEALRWLSIYTQPDNIGYEQGGIRPGELGKWNLYYNTMEMLPQNERLLISGLSASKVAAEEEKDEFRHTYGLDPDNPDRQGEIAEIERQNRMLDAMSDEEQDAYIAQLEQLLAETEGE